MSDAKQITDQELKQIFGEYEKCRLEEVNFLQTVEKNEICEAVQSIAGIHSMYSFSEVQSNPENHPAISSVIRTLAKIHYCRDKIIDPQLGFGLKSDSDGHTIYDSNMLTPDQFKLLSGLENSLGKASVISAFNSCPDISLLSGENNGEHDAAEL